MGNQTCKFCGRGWWPINPGEESAQLAVVFMDEKGLIVSVAHTKCAEGAEVRILATQDEAQQEKQRRKRKAQENEPVPPTYTVCRQILDYIRKTTDQIANPGEIALALGWREETAQHWMNRMCLEWQGEATLVKTWGDGYVIAKDRDARIRALRENG